MNAVPDSRAKRVVIYTRVSSEDQKERETIRTQQMELRRRLTTDPEVDFLGEYSDDGISGCVRFQDRPAGGRLLADAARGIFEEVWVYRIDRLGRDDIDPLVVWRELERLGVRVVSLTEGVDGPFVYHIRVAVAAEERRTMLMRMQAGMDRAAREGRYTGGIRPFGYQVVGYKEHARFVPAEGSENEELTEADIVRLMYERVGLEDRTCWEVADELNARGIATLYEREGRGVRGRRTMGSWGPGRVRNMLVNPMYKGERHYGRRSPRPGREVIVCPVPALVAPHLWQKAQDALAAHNCRPKNSGRIYPLRGIMKCGICGRTYVGSHWQGKTWYRCSGHLRRLGVPDVCRSPGLKASTVEARVWEEIERLLLEPPKPANPSPCLAAESGGGDQGRPALLEALARREEERKRLLAAYVQEAISLEEFQATAASVDQAKKTLEDRLRASERVQGPDAREILGEAAVEALRARLGGPLADAERQAIVQSLLERIVVHKEPPGNQAKMRLVIEHRLSLDSLVLAV